jgi:hypothetical protein
MVQVTESGNVYRLGMAAEAAPVGAGAISEAGSGGGGTAGGGMRRSSRATGKESVLDAFADSRHPVGEPQQQLSYQVGGADVGGAGADRIMRGAFETLDDNMVGLRTQYAAARRVVLYRDETPVAAAVVEVHPEQGVLEVPLLAAERHCRQQGHGTVLVAILIELGCRLRLAMLIASATHESTRFWLRQGLHTFSHCSPPVRAELRKIDQSARRGFANSVSMAMELPARRGEVLPRVLRRLARRAINSSRVLSSADAPAAIGYLDVNATGNFFLLPDGRKQPVVYGASERLAVNVPYSRLEAFPSGTHGWGVRCGVPISQGQVVVEVRGRCLSEAEYEELNDPSYVVSFDDKLLQLKRAAEDDVRYIDLKVYGNMMRLINDCHEAPNLQLMYWPELDVTKRILPRRAFLVAKHDIPSNVELTWDYGRHYERPWLTARHGTGWPNATWPTASGVEASDDEGDEGGGAGQGAGGHGTAASSGGGGTHDGGDGGGRTAIGRKSGTVLGGVPATIGYGACKGLPKYPRWSSPSKHSRRRYSRGRSRTVGRLARPSGGNASISSGRGSRARKPKPS